MVEIHAENNGFVQAKLMSRLLNNVMYSAWSQWAETVAGEYKTHEICIKHEECCTKNEEFCIKTDH